MTDTSVPDIASLNRGPEVTYANGLFIAYPDLKMVEMGQAWFRPSQVRSLVSAIRSIRSLPYEDNDRAVFIVLFDVTLESKDHRGLIYVEDNPFTPEQLEFLEDEALEAAAVAEWGTSH